MLVVMFTSVLNFFSCIIARMLMVMVVVLPSVVGVLYLSTRMLVVVMMLAGIL